VVDLGCERDLGGFEGIVWVMSVCSIDLSVSRRTSGEGEGSVCQLSPLCISRDSDLQEEDTARVGRVTLICQLTLSYYINACVSLQDP